MREKYESLPLVQLKELAKVRGLKGTSTMKKAELVEAMLAEDERLKKELLGDEKERAEHVMLVDLARNDMGRISEFGTVKVSQFMDVQNYSHVMHIVSLVEGKCREGIKPLDLAASFLPAGTLSGAPKIRAMEIIDELEDMRRGLYGGAAGYIDFNGNMDLCITCLLYTSCWRDSPMPLIQKNCMKVPLILQPARRKSVFTA